jgi:hypothetical protein
VDEAAMKKIVEGLEKGNLVPVTYVKNGNEEKVVAAANPQYKAVDLYGMDGKKLFVENAVKAGEGPGTANGQQVDHAQTTGIEAKVENEEKKGRKR